MVNSFLQYAVVNGVILSILFIYKRKSIASSKYYFALYLVFILALVEQLYIGSIIAKTGFTYSEFPIRFLFSPLFFLYISAFLHPQHRPSRRLLFFLFLPSMLDILACLIMTGYANFHHLSFPEKIDLIKNQPLYLFRSVTAISFSLYWNLMALKKIRNFLTRVKNVYAGIGWQQIAWLRNIAIVSAVLWSIWLCYVIAEFFYVLPRTSYIPLFILLGLVVIVHGYFALLKPDMAFRFSMAHSEIKANRRIEAAVQNEIITSDGKPAIEVKQEQTVFLQSLFLRLEACMEEKEVYADNDLSLSRLSKRLGETTSLISRAIAFSYQDNFYNYVNRFRVKKFLSRLGDEENERYTIDTLCYQCGFNSKATLYKYFKELTGMTPAAAQKMLRTGEMTVEEMVKIKPPKAE